MLPASLQPGDELISPRDHRERFLVLGSGTQDVVCIAADRRTGQYCWYEGRFYYPLNLSDFTTEPPWQYQPAL
jgi:hypothetical protein